MKMPARDHKLTGSAGEHFVCSTLAQLGWAASLTREGIAHADILAVRADLSSEQPERPMIEVQVKTMRHWRRAMWPVGERHKLAPAASSREWYVFVLLGETIQQRPRCWILPRDHLVAGAWITHMAWLTDPEAPRRRKDSTVRVDIDRVLNRYEERWDLLDEPADQAPLLLPEWVTSIMREPRIEFPDWHPWHRGSMPEEAAGEDTR